MPFALERHGDKAIVTNTKTGKHYSEEPIPIQRARSQMTILQNNVKHMTSLRNKRKGKEEDPKEVEPEPKRLFKY